MITIPIQVSDADTWSNKQQVKELLDQLTPGESILLDLCSEGPSLHSIGVVDFLNNYNLDIHITRWSNSVESVPYKKKFCNETSHFYSMSYHYWTDEIENYQVGHKFGLFIGRNSLARNRIMYDVYHQLPQQFLMSKMQNVYGRSWIDSDEWFNDAEKNSVKDWILNCTVTSLDNHTVQDQYQIPEVSSGNLARSLLGHYNKFNVELVCETYTVGQTFFPTEKTVRPIVGSKPFIVYGPAGYLNNLQQQGFRTFNNVWDESYDNYQGPQRWNAMLKLLKHLSSLSPEQWTLILDQTTDTIRHNREVLRKIIRRVKGINV